VAPLLWWDFRVDPQCRAAAELNWSSAQSAKVELQRFHAELRERTDTKERLVLAELSEKAGEGNVLRAVAGPAERPPLGRR
jgi:hypothetical protein